MYRYIAFGRIHSTCVSDVKYYTNAHVQTHTFFVDFVFFLTFCVCVCACVFVFFSTLFSLKTSKLALFHVGKMNTKKVQKRKEKKQNNAQMLWEVVVLVV